MQSFVDFLNGIIWSPALIYLCLGAGLFYSVLTRFVQVRHFFEMWRLLLNNKESSKGISSFQALAVSLSGRVGTGNIAGVAAAIGFGGPGAVFWMWMVAFFGAATAYAESTLAQIYKEEDNGEFRGGPAYTTSKKPWVKNGTLGSSRLRPSLLVGCCCLACNLTVSATPLSQHLAQAQ